MGAYGVYSILADILFNEITAIYYLLESLSFFAWAILLMARQERNTPKTINYDNILLCFYKGDRGSFAMKFAELFGLPVRSLCVVAGDAALMLKKTRSGFTIIDSKVLLKNKDNYVIVDTGKESTLEFIEEMKTYANKPASKYGMRIRCIEGISPLLEMIAPEFKPDHIGHNMPSWYMGKIA